MGSSHYSRPRYKVGFREAAAETGVLGYLGGFGVGSVFLIFYVHSTDWPLLPAVLVLIGFVLSSFLIATFMGMEASEDPTPWRSSSTASTAATWSNLPPAGPQHVDDVPPLPPASSPSSTSADSGGYDGGSGD